MGLRSSRVKVLQQQESDTVVGTRPGRQGWMFLEKVESSFKTCGVRSILRATNR